MNIIEKQILIKILTIRKIEEFISKNYYKQIFRCPVHLSIGQEAISSSLDLIFKKNDLCVSSHRAHAHYLGKGGDLINFFAEILGRKGCSGGKGGSMHLYDERVGFMGSTAIVGNIIPVGVGLSFAQKINNSKNLTIIFFGEGATEQGVFYESINFSALHNTPTLFICENNLYSVYSPLEVRQPKSRDLLGVVKKMGIHGIREFGNDPLKIYHTLSKAKKYIKKNKRPFFIEFKTYRHLEHCGPNNDDFLNYRKPSERKKWLSYCPVEKYKKFLINKKKKNFILIKNIEKKIDIFIAKSFLVAKTRPAPTQ
jgi:pyruvate dehydrogenase E1 component alpha subunit